MPPIPSDTSSSSSASPVVTTGVAPAPSSVPPVVTGIATSSTETVIHGVLDAAAPIALGATGWGVVLAPLAPKIIDFVFAEYHAIRNSQPVGVTHEEIIALLKQRALIVNVEARLSAAEAAAGVQ